MQTPIVQAEPMTVDAVDPKEAHLTPDQRELLRSLERGLEQAARGEYIPLSEVVAELRVKTIAEDI